MKLINIITNMVVDINEEDLSNMSEIALQELDVVNDEDYPVLLHAIAAHKDMIRLIPYYSKDDKSRDPNGLLRERYLDLYNLQEYNENNLLLYNHTNTKIFNELLDNKYDEVGSRKKLTNEYILEHWLEIGPACDSVVYGYDQDIVYKNLCAAFGKEKVDVVWSKYYN